MPDYAFYCEPRDAKGEKNEAKVQAAFLNKMRMSAPSVMIVGVPNAGKRTAWEGRQRKLEGMIKGFPDVICLHDGNTLFIEFKSGTGYPSKDQISCLNRLQGKGFSVAVFRNAESALEWVKDQWPAAFL